MQASLSKGGWFNPISWQDSDNGKVFLEADLEWPDLVSGLVCDCLLLPAILPVVLSRQVKNPDLIPSPRLAIASPELHRLQVAAAGCFDNEGFVDAIISRQTGRRWNRELDDTIVIGTSLQSSVSPETLVRFVLLIKSMMNVFAQWLGFRSPNSVAVGSPEDFPCSIVRPAGSYIAILPRWLGVERKSGLINSFALADQLASIWFGGLISAHGRNSRELLAGFRWAFALMWLSHAGETRILHQMIQRAGASFGISSPSEKIGQLLGRQKVRISAAVALEFYEWVRDNNVFPPTFSELCRASCGQSVSSDRLNAALIRDGIIA
ncbi:MAG: hypothetical protein ABI679_03535 [Gemmatimonadota bacterium]